MDNRVWNILCSNIRGLNASGKWDAIRNKIDECGCSIIFLQETKRANIDKSFIRKFAPRRFDCFDFVPSIGASSGLLVAWCSSSFQGTVVEKRSFCITVNFASLHNGDICSLTNVYGPCVEPGRSEFINWFRDCDVSHTVNWLFLGDFNFYRSLDNRNKPGGI
jgi:hypothetical protein